MLLKTRDKKLNNLEISEIPKNTRCCVCNNTTEFSVKYYKNDYIIVECKVCSFIFIPQYYSKRISYEDFKDEKVLEQIKKANDKLKIERHLLRYKFIRKYKPDGDLFDLGAGWGHFLLAGKQLGYNGYGIELKMPYYYSKNIMNLPVDHIDFFDMEIKEEKFDIITMWDVLEHIPEADEVIKKCSSLLRKGGHLVIQVPQIDSFIAKLTKDKWNMIGLSHANYFSKKTIKKLLNTFEFEVVKIKSSYELKLFLMYVLGKKQKTHAARQEYFNKTTQKPQWALNLMVYVHNIIYNTFSFFRIGEEMMLIAKKIKYHL